MAPLRTAHHLLPPSPNLHRRSNNSSGPVGHEKIKSDNTDEEPRAVSVQNKHWMRGGIEEEMGMGMVMMTVEMVMIVMMMVVVMVVISPCLF